MINQFKNGLAVISNTAKQGSDPRGEVISKLSVRVKSSLAWELRSMIQDLERENFDKIFQLTQKQSGTDVYSIKKLGLPNNALVFPIHSQITSGKKALLVFKGPFVQEQLTKTLENISEILDHAVDKQTSKNTVAAPYSGKIPPSISKHSIHKTNMETIKTRLAYLEDADSLTDAEKEEMQNLKEFIEQTMRNAFR